MVQVLRSLRRAPLVSAVAVISLALGIGANAAVASLLEQMLFRRLPVRDPASLVNLSAPGPKPGYQSCNQAGSCEETFSYPMFRDLQGVDSGLQGLAAHRIIAVNIAAGDRTVSGVGSLVSGNYFGLLGVVPSLGRVLQVGDAARPGERRVAVLSHYYWTTELGADPHVLGEEITVNGQALRVVGVAQAGFRGTTLGGEADVFMPITLYKVLDPGFVHFESRTAYWLYVFGRLADGIPRESAADRLGRAYQSILREVEAPLQSGMTSETLARFRERELLVVSGSQGQSTTHEQVRAPLLLLLAITATVLMIACVNIANLQLAQGADRATELAVRSALGASRRRLVGQLLAESLGLAVLSGAVGVLTAQATLSGAASVLPDPDGAIHFGISAPLVGFAAGLALLTGLVCGLYPALRTTRGDVASAIRGGGRAATDSPGAARFRAALVVVQLALSTTLLVSAGLFIKSLVNVARIDLGIDTGQVVQFSISPGLSGYSATESIALFERVEAELAGLPGVLEVGAGMVPILAGSAWGSGVSVEGFEASPDDDTTARYNVVNSDYFRTLGIELLAGRPFDERDVSGVQRVAIVNEAFARKFGLDASKVLDVRMSAGGAPEDGLDTTIIGLVRDAKYAQVKAAVPPMFFVPYRQSREIGQLTFYLRAPSATEPVLRSLPDVLGRLDPTLPIEDVKTLRGQVAENVLFDRFLSGFATIFAALATILAAVGLYGVLAYAIGRRRHEIGIRMALGADPWRIRAMVLRQVGLIAISGGLLGLVAAAYLGRAVASLLYELQPADPFVVVSSVGVLSLVALTAGLVPAVRASRVDPVRALRAD